MLIQHFICSSADLIMHVYTLDQLRDNVEQSFVSKEKTRCDRPGLRTLNTNLQILRWLSSKNAEPWEYGKEHSLSFTDT